MCGDEKTTSRLSFRLVAAEWLEPRQLLSVAHPLHDRAHPKPRPVTPLHPAHVSPIRHATKPAHHSKPISKITPGVIISNVNPATDPSVGPSYPADIAHFYGIDQISFNGITGDGAGQTIALIDAYDQPGLVDSTDPGFADSDLHQFDLLTGLPDPPSFVKIPQANQTALPTDFNSSWAFEEDLDVEWAHAIAPAANIVLVECASDADSDVFGQGLPAAQNYPGVTVVSMSFYAAPESTALMDELTYDSAFGPTTTNPAITYLASAGDQGAAFSGYPAFSPNVIAVGGTTITSSDSSANYGSEAVWNDSRGATGGNASDYEAKPYYQNGIALLGDYRGTPDVSLEADPDTGVIVYDSTAQSDRTLYLAGGTSLGCPVWAGLVAIADQGRALAGLGALNGFTQTLPRLYGLPASDFHDITVGNNDGNAAGVGYDLASGLGTPVANTLVPDLAGAASVSGQVFRDLNGDGVFDGTDTPVAGATVYLDLNNTGSFAAGDPTTVTDSSGDYAFTDLAGGLTGTVRLQSPDAGDIATTGSASFSTSYNVSQSVSIGLFATAFSSSADDTSYSVSLDSTASDLQIFSNSVLVESGPVALASSLVFSLTGNGDSLIIDATNGNPIPSGGISFTGGTSGDLLSMLGTASGNDSIAISAGSLNFNGSTVSFSNVNQLQLTPGSGIDSLNVSAGSVTIPASLAGIAVRNFSTIAIAAGASLAFATSTNRQLVEVTTLDIAGTLDLGGNDMIVHTGDIAAITALVGSAYNNGTWTGPGITSSAAATDPTQLTALGIASNDLGGGNTLFNANNLFDGVAPLATDLLIRYTFYGDANLDGVVDSTDYTLVDNGFLSALTGWFNGDFNYDSAINGSDYTLLDNAFNMQ
jgi:hypothetical protein